MQIVAPGNFLDGVVFAVFVMFASGAALMVFGEFHTMCVITKANQLGVFSTILDKIFPFPKKQFSFNLTHILLFAILISLLSMRHHPAQDVMKKKTEKELEKKASKEE